MLVVRIDIAAAQLREEVAGEVTPADIQLKRTVVRAPSYLMSNAAPS